MEALRIWEIWPQKKLIKVSVWRWREKDPQRQSRAQPPDSQTARASTDYCFRINLCAALSLGQRPGCRNPMSQQVAERHAPTWISDERALETGMSTNLKVLAAIDFGSAGKALGRQRAGTSILRKQQPILFQVIIEP